MTEGFTKRICWFLSIELSSSSSIRWNDECASPSEYMACISCLLSVGTSSTHSLSLSLSLCLSLTISIYLEVYLLVNYTNNRNSMCWLKRINGQTKLMARKGLTNIKTLDDYYLPNISPQLQHRLYSNLMSDLRIDKKI